MTYLKNKKIASLLIGMLTMCTLLTGCSNNNVSENVDELKNEIVFANFRDIRDPNPHLYGGEMWFQEMVYETLVSVEETGIEPCLAESWEISEDGLIYTFNIREGMTFSDGYVLDANAIELNFDALWDNKERHVWLESMNLITSYYAKDDYTFVIELSGPYYPLLTELGVTRPFAMASPNVMKDGTTKDGVTEYIGSGPYVLTENVVNEYAIFEVNENYWGEVPEIEKVTMKVIPDNQARIIALENGEIDLIYGAELIDAETLFSYENSEKFVSSTSEPLSTRHILLNTENKILEDINVRYALSHAVDKVMISNGIFNGIEAPADFLYAKSIPYCDVDLIPYEYDLELSKKYLEDSGWVVSSDGIREKDGERLSFRILYDLDSVTGKNISEYLQAEFIKIGVELRLECFERATYVDALKAGEFDIAHNISWGSPYDPESSLSAMTGRVYGDYAAQLNLPNKAELDSLIGSVFVTVDVDERQDIYDEILTILNDSAVYIPLTYQNNKSLYNNNIENVTYKPSQFTIPFWEMSIK
ncbi:MAG: nickel ABC transporter substrate-binding protein [Peptostreptococcaceae bacterium]